SAGVVPLVVSATAITCAGSPVRAQGIPPTSSPTTSQGGASVASGDELAEVVVTAQRREEALSKVPESVSAFNEDSLQTRAVQTEQDLAALVPGLIVKDGQ